MKKSLSLSALVLLLAAAAAPAQSVLIPGGKIAVFKGGDNTGVFPMATARVAPCYVVVYDTGTNNQATPWVNVPLPTNAPNGIWINPHAGSEGGGISRTVNRQFLALEGYTGNILSPTAAKPSSDPTVNRGLGTLDAFGNEQVLFQDPADWFGLPPGVTQNNPTGIASTDGTNFWGTGNVTGTSSEAAGTLFYNASVSPTPEELQNFIQAAAQARIINGTLYIVVPASPTKGGGVMNFLDPENNDEVAQLPWDPNVPNPIQHPVLTNVFLNWTTANQNIANFDMNAAGTVAYGADQSNGVVKFINNGAGWSQAYRWSPTNIGTLTQKAANRGCFGICVDFSGTNNIIYATTMENGIVENSGTQGHQNQNRLIRIVDTNASPGTNLVAQTLAQAQTTNEFFGGIDFTPDLSPLITFVTSGHSTTNGGSATYSVTADSVFPLSYQWLTNGVPLSGATSSNVTLSSLDVSFNGYTLQCVVTNQYGMVTSTPPSTLVVTASPTAPTITNAVANVAGFVGGTATFAPIAPTGTEPFTFTWYQGATQLSDGLKYSNSTTASLTISNLTSPGDAGNYTLVVSNAAGVASNVVDNLTVNFHLPVITAGEPQPATTFVGLNATLIGTSTGGTPPLTNVWFKGATATTVTNPATGPDLSGTNTDTLTINPAALSDAGFYKVVVANGGGSVTSGVVQLTVLVPPPHSAVSYSNQVYSQTFDSLPDPGSNSVNSINNPNDAGTINGVAYSLANPFDFAYPVINNNFVGGLGLSNTMPGWYGAADTTFAGVDGLSRFGAQDGDQTTGGVIDFGLNDNSPVLGTNRALGLLSTGTTGATTFALKLVNTSGQTLNYVSLGFVGELWRWTTGTRTMSFGYTLDNSATSFVLSAQSISNSTLVPSLAFSFQTNTVTGGVLDGSQPANQTNLNVTNLALNAPWPNGGALWLMWGIEFFGAGQGNGYAIDNFYLYASTNQVATTTTPLQLNAPVYVTAAGPNAGLNLSFTNVPSGFFSVYYTTNLVAPINWTFIGAPTEVPNGGFSTYQFVDPKNGDKMRFYKIVSP